MGGRLTITADTRRYSGNRQAAVDTGFAGLRGYVMERLPPNTWVTAQDGNSLNATAKVDDAKWAVRHEAG